jgi:hypothetical protein
MPQPPFTPRKIPGTHFCYRLSQLQGRSVAGRIKSIEKSKDLIGNQTRDFPACGIVPQPTTTPCPILSMATLILHNCSNFLVITLLLQIITNPGHPSLKMVPIADVLLYTVSHFLHINEVFYFHLREKGC